MQREVIGLDLEKLVNQSVIHKSYGKGIVQNIDEKYLEVNFVHREKVCRFVYPSCFYNFLVLEDEVLQEEINSVIEVWKQESGVLQKEELKLQYEKTLQGIEDRRLAAEEKKLRAAQRSMEHRSMYTNAKQDKKN